MEKYQPSNSTEGMHFCDKYCYKCINHGPDDTDKEGCEILLKTLCLSVKDPDYPEEWTYKENGEPTCTAYQYWDWDTYGDPDHPDNILRRPLPFNPNQLVIEF